MKNYQEYIRNSLQNIYPEDEINALAKILLQEVSGMSASLFLSDKSNQLNQEQEKRLDDILQRLQKSQPLQNIMGETEFYGLPFQVDSRVLIPRPETEELVDWVIQEYSSKEVKIVDIGTGSGCIAVTLAKKLPLATVAAWDVSSDALTLATKNAEINDVHVISREVDVLSYNHNNSDLFDVIVSNPPYIPHLEKREMHTNVLHYEPHLALFVNDDDPLIFYRRIAQLGLVMLKDDGKIFFEINASQGEQTVTLLKGLHYRNIELRKDLSGNDRMIVAQKPN